ncbi:MAG: hypothetical protein KDD70_17630 [Bdellovibrionales bacterium]|nr:hypothetical protein [Bdellovibrionales bacterium]
MTPRKILPLLILVLSTSFIGGCANLNDPYYNDPYDRGYGYPPSSYPARDYYRDRERDRIRDERQDLEEERRRVEDERRRLERQRERERQQAQKPVYSAPPKRESCPSGWRPGRCSTKDRKHGCKDMRMPGGLGCRTN